MMGVVCADVKSIKSRSQLTTAAALVSLVVSVLPAFLLGGLAVLVRQELVFGEAALGVAISSFFLASMVGAVPGGWIAERLGGLRATALGVLGSSLSLACVALFARSWPTLASFLALGGLANAVIQPATNLALARAVPVRRQGLAFGLKQTNGPVATFLAGISAPLVGLTIGWRWAFGLAAILAFGFFLVAPRPYTDPESVNPPRRRRARDAPGRAVALTAIGAGAGTAAASSLIGFYVESAVATGLPLATAGWWFAAGSVAGTVARVAWGWVADRTGRDGVGMVLMLLVSGAVGFVLFAVATAWPMFLLATVLAFTAGWGWFGLLMFAVVQDSPSAPAQATALVIAGVSAGGTLGPPVFGLLVQHAGYLTAWGAAAAALVVAAIFVAGGARLVTRTETDPPGDVSCRTDGQSQEPNIMHRVSFHPWHRDYTSAKIFGPDVG